MSTPMRHAGARRAPGLVARVLAVLLLWTACVPGVEAQVATPVLSILQVDDSAYPQVRILLAAADANGIHTPGLTAAGFVVTEDSRPGDILSAQEVRGGVPLYLALALDTSGSMAGPPLQSTVQAAQALVSRFTSADQAALLKFGSDVALGGAAQRRPFGDRQTRCRACRRGATPCCMMLHTRPSRFWKKRLLAVALLCSSPTARIRAAG